MLMTNDLSDPSIIKNLNFGKVGIIPTDTVYGVVCLATDKSAVERLYKLKNRSDKPGTIIAASSNQLVELGFKARYLKAVERFWPNAISIVIPCGAELSYIHQGKRSIAVRIPADLWLNRLLRQTGPLLTSSANKPGESPIATADQAITLFGDSIDFVIDGGDLSGRLPSTVIRIVDDAIEVLRSGVVNINEQGEIRT